MNLSEFQQAIRVGIPAGLPDKRDLDTNVAHAPVRVLEGVLRQDEKILYSMTSTSFAGAAMLDYFCKN